MGFLPEPREHMREAGIFPCIVAGLRKHKANHTVVEECICAISNACVLNTANQDSLGMQGAVEATVQAMEQHREHVKTQDYGCRALRNLADNSEFNIRLEGDCGAIVAAALAMLGFPDNPILAEQACAALLNMARSEQNVIRMLEQDVQDIVNQALAVRNAITQTNTALSSPLPRFGRCRRRIRQLTFWRMAFTLSYPVSPCKWV